MSALVPSDAAAAVSRHLSLRVADTSFGVPIRRVKEVVPFVGEVRTEVAPRSVRGVMSVRGQPVPLIDLGFKFRREAVLASSGTAVVVVEARVETGTLRFGLVADRVDHVVDLRVSDVDPPPVLENGLRNDWLEGLGYVGDELLMLLDLDRILTTEERLRISHLSLHPKPN